ncbi:uncharacterized protein LOC112589994 [Harpegnathos saltator]|uniref:uncharacterized protein LOC112589994 n=1 Tax=Harpegnathos saltator TaxID=610380 RepID=UPI000DBED844|nr:uncharacterized protein LOC112589994 [Harpegnathos saltator]
MLNQPLVGVALFSTYNFRSNRTYASVVVSGEDREAKMEGTGCGTQDAGGRTPSSDASYVAETDCPREGTSVASGRRRRSTWRARRMRFDRKIDVTPAAPQQAPEEESLRE